MIIKHNIKECLGCIYMGVNSDCVQHPLDCIDYGRYTKPVEPKRMRPMSYKDIDQKVVGKGGGIKNDKGKARWSLVPLDTIEGIADVLTYGAKKYEDHNWKKMGWDRNFDALLRHLAKWLAGEECDDESGLHHLDHALCDLMFVRWYIKYKGDK